MRVIASRFSAPPLPFVRRALSTRASNPLPFEREFSNSRSRSLSARILGSIHLQEEGTPIERGYNYLVDSCSAKRCYQPLVSATRDFARAKRSPFPEIFDTCLILDLLKLFDPITVERGLCYIAENRGANGLFGFFEDPSLLPQDVDDTSLAMLVLLKYGKIPEEDAKKVAGAVLSNVDEKGVIQTYFSPRDGRDGRVDPSVCANAVRLAHRVGRGDECKPTEDYLYSFLERMEQNSMYYNSDTFFYFMWETLKTSAAMKKRFESLFIDRLISRMGATSTPIGLSCRVAVCAELGIQNSKEVDALSRLQEKDASWPVDVAYTGSRKNLYWGSKAVSTAFALYALDRERVLSSRFQVAKGKLRFTDFFSSLPLMFQTTAITHTETPASRDHRFYDLDPTSPNNALTEKGKSDALTIAHQLREQMPKGPLVILHGENARTRETAHIVKTQFPRAKLQSAAWLNEINCTDWYGRSTQEVLNSDLSAAAMFYHSDCLAKCPRGESFLDVLNRVYAGLCSLQKHRIKEIPILLCTSRVNAVAFKVLLQRDIETDPEGNIHWSAMSRKVGPGTVLHL